MSGNQSKTKHLWQVRGFWWVLFVALTAPLVMIATPWVMFRLDFNTVPGAFITIMVILLEFMAAGGIVIWIGSWKEHEYQEGS